jgi:hypothetical protein
VEDTPTTIMEILNEYLIQKWLQYNAEGLLKISLVQKDICVAMQAKTALNDDVRLSLLK